MILYRSGKIPPMPLAVYSDRNERLAPHTAVPKNRTRMEIKIDNRRFKFGGQKFAYSFYFIDDETHDSITSGAEISNGQLCKWLFGKWAHALRNIDVEKTPMFLPFLPDDQEIECFQAEYRNGVINFTRVDVQEDGWDFDWNNIEGFIISPHEIRDQQYVPIGGFEKDEVISALINARVDDEL
jgi:hypothetical protein